MVYDTVQVARFVTFGASVPDNVQAEVTQVQGFLELTCVIIKQSMTSESKGSFTFSLHSCRDHCLSAQEI